MKKNISILFAALVLASMLLSACGGRGIIPGMPDNATLAETVTAPEPPSQAKQDAACVGHDGETIQVDGFNVTCPESKETVPAATEAPVAETPAKAEKQVFLYTPFTTAVPLINFDLMIGVRYDLTDDKPYRIVTPPQSVSTVACGSCSVDTMRVSTNEKGTVGNTVVIVNRSTSENMVNTVHDFVAGNVSVTTIFAGAESPNKTALSSVSNMFQPKNCGNKCLWSNLYEFGGSGEPKSFTSTPTEDQMGLAPFDEIVVTIAAGETDAAIVKVDEAIVGYTFHLSGEKQHVGVTEGSVTIITCTSDECKIQGATIVTNETAVLYHHMNDGVTPNDLNWTATTSGDMDVTILTTTEFQALLPDSFTKISMDGETMKVGK